MLKLDIIQHSLFLQSIALTKICFSQQETEAGLTQQCQTNHIYQPLLTSKRRMLNTKHKHSQFFFFFFFFKCIRALNTDGWTCLTDVSPLTHKHQPLSSMQCTANKTEGGTGPLGLITGLQSTPTTTDTHGQSAYASVGTKVHAAEVTNTAYWMCDLCIAGLRTETNDLYKKKKEHLPCLPLLLCFPVPTSKVWV